MQMNTMTNAVARTKSRTESRRSLWGILIAVALLPTSLHSQEEKAAKARFDPHRHLPIESLFHLHIPSVRGLGDALATTLPGRILADPEVRIALGNVPEQLHALVKRETGGFIKAFGKDPIEVLELFGGELILSVTGLDPSSYVSIVFAVEIEDRREEFLSLLGNLERFVEAEGGTVGTVDIAGHEVRKLHLAGPPLHHLMLGDHLVLALSPTVLEGICRAFDRDAKQSEDDNVNRDLRLVDNKGFQRVHADLTLESSRLRLVLNAAGLRGLGMQALQGSPTGEQVREILRVSGLSSLGWLGYGLGEKGGDVEGVVSIQSARAQRGLIGAALESISAPADKDAILQRLPADVKRLFSYAIDTGAVLKSVYDVAKSSFSGIFQESVEAFVARIEADTGLSAESIFALPRIEFSYFAVDPPGGGWVPDTLGLVRTAELAPYLKAFDTMVEKNSGKNLAFDEEGTQITYRRTAGVASWWRRSISAISGGEQLFPLEPSMGIASAPIDDQWSVVSAGPQPIIRYLRYHAKAPKIARDGNVARWFLEVGEDQCVAVFSPSTFSLAMYNTVLNFLPARLQFPDPFPAHLELWRLPPGEKFMGGLTHATMSLEWDDDAIRARGEGVMSATFGYFAPPIVLAALAGLTTAGYSSF